jgi:hypothetical protein
MFADARAAYRARARRARSDPGFWTARWKKFAPNETGRRRKMTKTRREIDAAMNAKITLVCIAPTVRYWL